MLNAYDGLTHGSGTGVQGDTKDLTELTTFNRGNYEMVSSNGRLTTYDAGGEADYPALLQPMMMITGLRREESHLGRQP